MKITQFGLCYSPNLGDGVIAECLAHGLRMREPSAEITHVDLSGRQAFGAVTIANRETILAIVDRLPLWLRQRLALWKLNHVVDGVEADWRKAAQCDLAVIGGGQILSDANLNFPIKVSRAARLLSETRAPTAIYAVGVSRNWTHRGAALFGDLLGTDLRLVGPRDNASAAAITVQLPGAPEAEVIADPGLLAAECYGPQVSEADLIGVCVTDFTLLGHHADSAIAGQAIGGARFYCDLVRALRARGHRVRLFSNGAAEDRDLRRRVAAQVADDAGVDVPPDAERPATLVAQIAGCSAVVAHRLHACIVAHSYGRAIVGLGWDRKLQSFFEGVGLSANFTGDPSIDADGIAILVEGALTDIGMLQAMEGQSPPAVADAWAGIDRLLACVRVRSEG
ncbi:polysaccharide pyruvyl transferase family protein [Jannaschia sp. 2305UL9-9]|uniref:polysaccharide pyruvyl transferase family protein n=1 Tax=Jannaschia sp. 2305UL9-9 TaxID=3121638 RepID=UPI0035293EE9